MNALEIAKQLLKSIQDNPEAGEQLKKSLQAQPTPAPEQPKGFQKSMLDEDYAETFAKAKKERTVENLIKPDKCPKCGKGEKMCKCMGKDEMKPGQPPQNPNKGIKGVHVPVIRPTSGTSAMGVSTNPQRKRALANQVLREQHQMRKPNLPKSEKNPDKAADAALGERVEGLVEGHMAAHKVAERKEGHKVSFHKDMLKEEYGKSISSGAPGVHGLGMSEKKS